VWNPCGSNYRSPAATLLTQLGLAVDLVGTDATA
jgi:hypothetical protein